MPEGIHHLSAAMAAGDAGAVDRFYRQYFDWMYGQARRVTRRDESFCLDVVQDAVLRVMRTVKSVDCESRFRGWLRLVVQTTAFDLLRSETRRKNRDAMAGISQPEMGTDSLQLDWLRDQIAELDPDLVNLIELRFTQRWPLRRIGERLGLSIGVVDGRLRRALKNLKLAAEDPPMPAPPTPVVELELVDVPTTILENVFVLMPVTTVEPAATRRFDPPPVLITSEVLVLESQQAATSGFTLVESTVMAEESDLVGLEDEAGAYDDRI